MKTRTLVLIAAALGVMALTAGCHSGSDNSTAPSGGSSTATTTTAPAGASAPAAPAAPAANLMGPPAAPDNTSVPTTTTINGKSVPLQKTADGLEYFDIRVGKGPAAKPGDTVSVNYVGTLIDGSKFDSSYDRHQAFSFGLGAGQVIPGWDEGIAGMKVGGKRRLVIPASLGYGASAQPKIPANSTLIFDVELLGVK